MITAQLIRHSINPWGNTISSWILEYPRFIHSELMTHRDFSRNAASSRAIPLDTSINALRGRPAMPLWWGSHLKGMQSGAQLEGGNLVQAKHWWIGAMHYCIDSAKHCDRNGLHKSLTNRLLEPWMHMRVVVTLTDPHNFFALRAHPDAQPEFQVLAYRMLEVYLASTPEPVAEGGWHLPFADKYDESGAISIQQMLKVCTARCCWASYGKPDREIGARTTLQDAYDRHDASIQAGHWSPFEHCAQAVSVQADPRGTYPRSNFDTDPECLSGWFQYRKQFSTERRTADNTDLKLILANRPEWTKTAGVVPNFNID